MGRRELLKKDFFPNYGSGDPRSHFEMGALSQFASWVTGQAVVPEVREMLAPHYNRPPCRADEHEVVVPGGAVFCGTHCSAMTSCPTDLPGKARGLRKQGPACGISGSAVAHTCYIPCLTDADCDVTGGASCMSRHPIGTCAYLPQGDVLTV